MATLILSNAYVALSGVEVSSSVQKVSITYQNETKDNTAMGNDTKSNKAGLKNWSMQIDLFQDYADNSIDELVWNCINNSPVSIAVKPVSGTTSASNPCFSGQAVVTDYSPVAGTVGDLPVISVKLVPAGTLARAVA